LSIVLHLRSLPAQYPGIMALNSATVNLMGCRSFEQFCCTARALQAPERFCPFCQTEIQRRGRKAESEAGDWMLIKNEFPHTSTRQMFLAIPRRHVVKLTELSVGDWQDMAYLIERCTSRIEGGGIMWRFGDARYNVGTVQHLHLNIIEPIPGIEYRPPFAKSASEHSEDYARMVNFTAKLVREGGEKWLFSDKGIEETQPKVS